MNNSGGNKNIVQGAWKILQDEYLDLWGKPERSLYLEKCHEQYWSNEGFDKAKLFTKFENDTPVATVALSPVTPKTWFLHHYGIPKNIRALKKKFLDFGREACLDILYQAQNQQGLQYVAMFLEADKRWNDFLYGNLAKAHNNIEELLWLPFTVYRADTTELPPDNTQNVYKATPKDLLLISQSLQKSRTVLESQAFGWDQPDIGIGSYKTSPHMDETQFRSCYVYFLRSEPVYVIVMDVGNEGANLFGLLNVCRLVPLKKDLDSVEIRQVQKSLLGFAKKWYNSLGVKSCLLFDEDNTLLVDYSDTGFSFVSKGQLWLGKKKMIPVLCDHLNKVFDKITKKKS